MKKIFSLILAVCMVLCTFSVTAFAAEKDREATEAFFAKLNACDCDGNGKVEIDDARCLLRVAASIAEAPEGAEYDLDGDGFVTARDALKALRVAIGVDAPVSNADVLEYLTSELNWVKTAKPGFTRTTNETCTSFKITCSGAPLLVSSLNATDMEYKTWLDKNKTLLKMVMTDEEYDDMVEQANDAYLPQVNENTVAAKSGSHYSYFPVNTCSWSCKLTQDDIKTVSYKQSDDGKITITVNMNNNTYDNNTYPGGKNQYSARQALPYGKAFNLPVLDGVTKMELKAGKIVCVIDTVTGGVVSADYSYNYIAQKAADAEVEDSSIKMSTKIGVTIKEHYDVNAVTE